MSTHTITRQQPLAPWVQVIAWVRGGSLDDRLARGADPRSDALLQARAAWLTSPRRRHRLAAALIGVLDQAREPSWVVDTRVAVPKQAVLDAEPQVVEIVDALRGRHNVAPGPVAAVSRLLADGKGPLHTGTGLGTVMADLAGRLGRTD